MPVSDYTPDLVPAAWLSANERLDMVGTLSLALGRIDGFAENPKLETTQCQFLRDTVLLIGSVVTKLEGLK